MTAKLTELITAQDNRTVVRDKIAQILLEESAAQVALAQSSAASAYTRAGASDYRVTASQSGLALGVYTATAGELTDGVGTWTLVPPGGGEGEECTTENADDDLVFSETGLTLAVAAWTAPFETGDVIAATVVDPHDYRFRVFTGRCNPIGNWIEGPDLDTDAAQPIIHVWFERHRFERDKSDVIESQRGPATFFVDCFGYGKAKGSEAGHTPADVKSEAEADWALTLVRQILCAAVYTYLDLQGTVGERFPESVDFFRPTIGENQPVQHVAAYRLTLAVELAETSPQVTGEPLETITHTVKRQEDGEVFLQKTQDWSGG